MARAQGLGCLERMRRARLASSASSSLMRAAGGVPLPQGGRQGRCLRGPRSAFAMLCPSGRSRRCGHNGRGACDARTRVQEGDTPERDGQDPGYEYVTRIESNSAHVSVTVPRTRSDLPARRSTCSVTRRRSLAFPARAARPAAPHTTPAHPPPRPRPAVVEVGRPPGRPSSSAARGPTSGTRRPAPARAPTRQPDVSHARIVR